MQYRSRICYNSWWWKTNHSSDLQKKNVPPRHSQNCWDQRKIKKTNKSKTWGWFYFLNIYVAYKTIFEGKYNISVLWKTSHLKSILRIQADALDENFTKSVSGLMSFLSDPETCSVLAWEERYDGFFLGGGRWKKHRLFFYIFCFC